MIAWYLIFGALAFFMVILPLVVAYRIYRGGHRLSAMLQVAVLILAMAVVFLASDFLPVSGRLVVAVAYLVLLGLLLGIVYKRPDWRLFDRFFLLRLDAYSAGYIAGVLGANSMSLTVGGLANEAIGAILGVSLAIASEIFLQLVSRRHRSAQQKSRA